MAESGCLKDGHFQNLEVENTLMPGKRPVIVLTSDKTLRASDSGSLIVLNSATAINVTLPDPNGNLGVFFDINILAATATTGHKILVGDQTPTTGDIFEGSVILGFTEANEANGQTVVPDTTANTIVLLDDESSEGGGGVGGQLRLTVISDQQWLVEGTLIANHAGSNGTAIFATT